MYHPHRHIAAASLMTALAIAVFVLSALSLCDDWGTFAMVPALLLLMWLGRRGRRE